MSNLRRKVLILLCRCHRLPTAEKKYRGALQKDRRTILKMKPMKYRCGSEKGLIRVQDLFLVRKKMIDQIIQRLGVVALIIEGIRVGAPVKVSRCN